MTWKDALGMPQIGFNAEQTVTPLRQLKVLTAPGAKPAVLAAKLANFATE
jgi:hypothetical protein